jgi:hypothetical protein
MGTTNRVVTLGEEEWGSSWCIFHEKELQDPAGIIRQALGTTFGSSRQADVWKSNTRGDKVGSTWVGSERTAFRLGDCQVCLKVGKGCLRCL